MEYNFIKKLIKYYVNEEVFVNKYGWKMLS